jgi:3-hydroxyisobutyrate dehydrogenase
MDVVRQSALYAPTFDKKLKRMCDRNFVNPNFPTKHLLKDTNLFLTQAAELGLNTKSLEGIKQIIQTAIAQGLAEKDYSAIYCAIEISNE